MTAAAPSETVQLLTFSVAGEEYAVGILRVREIIQYENVTRVPMTPPWVRGVMNLRGSVVPVVDLAVKFGLSETPVGPSTCAVIVEVELAGQFAVMGVMADSVDQVVDLPLTGIEPPPPFGTRVRVEYLQGMAKLENGLALILDIDRVLSADELLAVVQAIEEPDGSVEAKATDPDAERSGGGTPPARRRSPAGGGRGRNGAPRSH
jgi:purine-binding chemotaxis protein CheW